MTHAVTLELPDTLYDQLKSAAELTRYPIEHLIEQSLAHTISPLLEDIPRQYQREVYPLLELDEDKLMEETRRVFPSDLWDDYEVLLGEKKERSLTDSERSRLEILRSEADILMLRKGYAALLLKRRGYPSPTLNELPKVS